MRLSPARILVILLIAAGPSCSDPERPGETGGLRFRFGVQSCASTPIAKTPLAQGGRSKLIILDDQQRELLLSVSSAEPSILAPGSEAVQLRKGCNELECDVSVATLWLTAASAGRSRLAFTQPDGGLADAVTFSVAEPASLELREYKKSFTSPLHLRQGASLSLQAVPKDAKGQELFAYEPYAFSTDGGVRVFRGSGADPSETITLTTTPEAQVGDTGLVSATFGAVSAELPIVVDAPPPKSN
jgi:hypothetical protein